MLEQIRGPADLQHLSQSQLSDSGTGNPRIPDPQGRCNRRASRPQPRCGGAHACAASRVRFAARPDHLRHRPSGLCAQDADGPQPRLRHVAQEGRPVGLSVAQRERARLGGVQPRQLGAVVCRRPGQGVRALRAPQPPCRRRRRRRRADRRHVLGGAEQHRRGAQAGRDRRQRQRPQLCPDDRRVRRAPGRPAAAAGLREGARRGPQGGARRAAHRRVLLPVPCTASRRASRTRCRRR